jgi:hypothetical protein
MINERKISIYIDEVDQYFYFQPENENNLVFDKQIRDFCLQVNHICDYIKKK